MGKASHHWVIFCAPRRFSLHFPPLASGIERGDSSASYGGFCMTFTRIFSRHCFRRLRLTLAPNRTRTSERDGFVTHADPETGKQQRSGRAPKTCVSTSPPPAAGVLSALLPQHVPLPSSSPPRRLTSAASASPPRSPQPPDRPARPANARGERGLPQEEAHLLNLLHRALPAPLSASAPGRPEWTPPPLRLRFPTPLRPRPPRSGSS